MVDEYPKCNDKCKGHNRLDLKLQSVDYRDKDCGTASPVDGEPRHCCGDCPLLA